MLYFKLVPLLKSILPILMSFGIKVYFRENVLNNLILYTKSNDNTFQSGLIMASMISICQYLMTAFLSFGDFLQLIEGSKMIQNLQKRILKKSIKVNLSSQQKFTRSRISQMINQECKKFDVYYLNLAFVIVIPIQILHSIYILYKNLGWYWIVVASSQLIVFVISFQLSKYNLIYRKKGQEQTHLRASLVQSTSESMRLIKGQNYEDVFYNKLDQIREKELFFIDRMAEMINIKHYLVKFSQPITMTVILLYYIFIDVQTIDIAIIFALEQSFWAVRQGLGQFPKFLSSFQDQTIILQQIQEFLNIKELDKSQISQDSQKIFIKTTTNKQDLKTKQLEDSSDNILTATSLIPKYKDGVQLDIDIKLGDIIVIKGPTGSGKSYLLKCLLGEFGGTIHSERKISYVGQDNWLQNKSIKENIILDKEYDQDLFDFVVKCFELDKDFQDFDYVITSSVDNISGGQKQRINLARAFYANNSNLVLLDDSFCSLDKKVMKQIITNILMYFKPNKNIVFTINENELIENCADILIEISQDHQILQIKRKNDKQQNVFVDDKLIQKDIKSLKKPIGKRFIEFKLENAKLLNIDKKANKQEQGFSLFITCFKKYVTIDKIIGVYLVLALVSISLYSLFYFGQQYVLMNWNILSISQNIKILLYLVFCYMDNIVQGFRIYFSKKQGLYASKRIHKLTSSTLLNADYQLYLEETITPHKFQDLLTTQIQGIDFDLSTEMTRIFYASFQIINAICLTLWGSLNDPITLIGIGLFLNQGIKMAKQRISNSQQIQMKIKETNQPIIGYVNECLSGLEYIRIYDLESYILDQFKHLQQKSIIWAQLAYKNAFVNDLKFSTFTFILNFVSLLSCLIGSNPLASLPKATSNSQIDYNTMQAVKCFNNIFVQLISFQYVVDFLQKIQEFNSIEQSQQNQKAEKQVKKIEGEIKFINYSAYYSSEKDQNKAALKNINLEISKGQKVCVVGRTGSGKTSLTLSILNLIHYKDGEIQFDGKKIDGKTIRDNISAIQQENIVMKGTLKENIDTFNLFSSEEDLWKKILQLNLSQILEQNQLILSMKIEEQGKNLSAGQKQIVSLVRALIQDKNIILFDEANSNLDEQNENLMQDILLGRNSTMIFIAHKIKHVSKFDRIIYLENGQITEDGSPKSLLSNQNSKFFKLYNSQS
ncbi:ATP-binding ABC transporter (macronuclear) [Tetrahymena thermophila SB210]|uniref:ATP-binding ABC transporter n=1 Tax=Tetrahymena thermophila (strain SB210) TaxID=312017 RepID=Q22W37_TETTS|nr:ATP-binding ABC transporter [Tetrahymena thermophila SB210]EAR89580.2 ATP-binding ABC transporter [Tetrahymena thermophila SB210]|eukprot:XP_001009825.2 ATP-binding ABC transporter [Tetrahymena thermophila SB210]